MEKRIWRSFTTAKRQRVVAESETQRKKAEVAVNSTKQGFDVHTNFRSRTILCLFCVDTQEENLAASLNSVTVHIDLSKKHTKNDENDNKNSEASCRDATQKKKGCQCAASCASASLLRCKNCPAASKEARARTMQCHARKTQRRRTR